MISARNVSVIQMRWLPCRTSDILVSKEATFEPGANNIVDYRITLRNPWSFTMAASVVDSLPGGMWLINSSMQPSDSDVDRVTWMIIDLPPGQTKIIEYKAKAQQKGILINRASVEAYAAGGPNSVTAEASVEVEVREGKIVNVSGWKSPACFDLNYSAPCAEDDLSACYSYSAPVEKREIICASCIYSELDP